MPAIETAELLSLGQKVDGGVTPENMLASIASARLREDACDFSIDRKTTKTMIFKAVKAEQADWIRRMRAHLQNAPPPAIAPLIKAVKKKQTPRR